jgi:hypothetical protein
MGKTRCIKNTVRVPEVILFFSCFFRNKFRDAVVCI